MIRHIALHTPHGSLHGQLDRPENPRGLILIARAHRVPDDDPMIANLAAEGYAILAMDLLTAHELQFADATQNVPRLAQRLLDILDLIRNDGDMQELPLGIYANGDASPAAIRCAAQRDIQVKALACHGGLIDRAGLQSLELLVAPLLVIFEHDDALSPAAYQRAIAYLGGAHQKLLLGQGDHPLAGVTAWFARHLVH
jgi:dienelactone hydrolase